MGNKAKISGHHAIANARTLFEASASRNAPDFRYIALAIGAAPSNPPQWAIRACVEEKERQQSKPAALDMRGEIAVILDELVRVFDDHQSARGSDVDLPLRAAINLACANLRLRSEMIGSADDNWQRDVVRSWHREQQQDALSGAALTLESWKITGRIERVLLARMGPEFGYPADPVRAYWEAIIEEEADRPRDS